MRLFHDFIEHDLPVLSRHYIGKDLARQLARSLDSICANLEEGYGRKFGNEFKHFVRTSEARHVKARVDISDANSSYPAKRLRNV